MAARPDKSLTEQQHLDFIAAAGEEFAGVMSPLVGDDGASAQDCYTVLSRVLGRSFTPEHLRDLDASQLDQLRTGFCRYFELDNITTAHLKNAMNRTLRRWPPVS